MKTQNKNSKSPYLQARNKRWKWMAGATAATAAGVTASQASTITVNLLNNYISNGGNNLNADLTGDGHPDLTIANAHFGNTDNLGYHILAYIAGVTLNGVQAYCRSSNTGNSIEFLFANMRLGSRFAHNTLVLNHYLNTTARYGTPSLMGSIPIFFKDLHINGGTDRGIAGGDGAPL